MSSELVRRVEREAGIGEIVLNRPEKRNALCVELLERLVAAIEEMQDQRVILLRGAGEAFCAGLDLAEAQDPTRSGKSAQLVSDTLEALAESSAIMIAVVHGAAIAGGAGIMSACDFVVAEQKTRIGYPEVHRGLVAGLVMTFLRRQLRERHVRELLVLGEIIDAPRAYDMGLVNRVVPNESLDEVSLALARQVLRGAPEAVRRTKRMIGELWPRTVHADLEWAHAHHLEARDSPEAREGRQAFFEKRPPRWS